MSHWGSGGPQRPRAFSTTPVTVMAGYSRAAFLTAALRSGSFAVCLLAWAAAGAQPLLTLHQAELRTGPDFKPLYENQELVVRGQISSKPLWVIDSFYLPIQDNTGYGLVLLGTARQFEKLSPGQWIEARGTLSKRSGMPVLLPASIQVLRSASPPGPRQMRVADVVGFRYMAVLVTIESEVAAVGENGGGDVLSVGERGNFVTVFLPKTRREASSGLGGFNLGDRVRVTGIATQYCPLPPYDSSFQIIIPEASAVALLAKTSLLPPSLLFTALGAIALVLGLWWLRERGMARQRRTLRRLNALGEEIVAANSPGEILKRLAAVMPSLSGATGVHLYVFNRRSKTLDQVPEPSDPEPVSVAVDTPLGGLAAAAAVCFRNRALLNIPDTRRSPFIAKSGRPSDLPRSVMFVPAFAQNELLGVLEVDHSGSIRYFTQEEQAATQHLANQVATSLKLQEQHSMREQLFRSEKLAATGQLISGIASELRAPLESIRKLSSTLLARNTDASRGRDLHVLAAESQRAFDIVARLVSFGRPAATEAKLVEVNELLADLLKFRAHEWDMLGVEAETSISREPMYIMGARGQLEEVFLNLLVHAEQSVLEAPAKQILVSTGVLANTVLVEIGYTIRPGAVLERDASGQPGSSVLEVCRGIVQSHGGEIRFVQTEAARAQFQTELPIARPQERSPSPRPERRQDHRPLTILLVEPDAGMQRHLVALLGARGHRVVPIPTAEEGVEMAHRLHFDAAFSATGLPGLNWVEFFERVRSEIGAFVLMTEGFDADLSHTFPEGDGFVLGKPLQDDEVEAVLEQVATRLETVAGKPAR